MRFTLFGFTFFVGKKREGDRRKWTGRRRDDDGGRRILRGRRNILARRTDGADWFKNPLVKIHCPAILKGWGKRGEI